MFDVRSGATNLLALLLISIALVLALGILAVRLRPDAQRAQTGETPLRVYCAAGIAKPVEKVISKFCRQYHSKVEIVRTGGSGELAGQIKTEFETGMRQAADLYVTADDVLLAKARDEGIVAEQFPLAEQRPVIAVAANSRRKIDGLADLLADEDIRFGVASEKAAVGKLARKIAKREGLLKLFETKKATDSENVMTLAQALVTGSLDAAIIWDTTVDQINTANQRNGNDSSEAIQLKIAALADPNDMVRSNIALGVLKSTASPTRCLRFARYLSGSDFSKDTFESYGFRFLKGDDWEEVPKIHLYCGSMFTPVLESRIRNFAKREGANVYPRWEGCGKLVASIRSVKDPELFPDAFLACDHSCLDIVQDKFSPPVEISRNEIVMAIAKQIPKSLTSPEDLLEMAGHDRKIRIGFCDPEQSALGKLTKELLSQSPHLGVYEKLKSRVSVTVDVGPTLMSQLLSGGLDIAFVYRSNVLASKDWNDKIRIVSISGDIAAIQPWAVSRQTRNALMMQRLFETIVGSDVQQDFENNGFHTIK